MTIPNLLSTSRYLLAAPMAYLVALEIWLMAAVVLWLAIATDIADGYLARKSDQVTPIGGLLDHSADAFFVSATLGSLVYLKLVPLVLPVVVVAAFLQYMLDSSALAGKPLRTSSLGRYNGICYFVLAGFPVMQHAMGIYLIKEAWFFWLGWGLVLSSLISMVDRGIAFLKK